MRPSKGACAASWETVLAEARDPAVGHNLVIHEFAHQLDFLDGYTNGTPPLRSREQARRWHVVMQGAFHRLRRDLQQGQKTFLGSYAATNPTEFFSVASEKFFTLPAELRRRPPQLFGVLAEYYRVDPARWFEGNAAVAALPATPSTLENVAAENAPPVRECEPEPVRPDFIDYQCPYCHNPVSFPKADAGTLKACPNCLEPAFVPERSGLPASGIPIPVRTERLVLRRFEALDAKDLADVVSNPETLRYLNWTALTLEEAEDWVASQRQLRFPKPGEFFNFAIEAVQVGRVIGFITFWFWADDFDVAQFELAIHHQWQGQGFATEAVRGLFGFAFAGLRTRRLVAECDSRNLAARKLLLKVGMRQESVCVEDRLMKG